MNNETIDRIERKISYMPFEERMKVCESKSRQSLSPFKPKLSTDYFSNYELEYISLKSVTVKSECSSYSDKEKWLYQITRIIRNDNIIGDVTKETVFKFIVDKQISPQLGYLMLYYRMYYMFTFKSVDLDMNKEFYDKFSVNYIDFVYFAMLITSILSSSEHTVNEIVNNFGNHFLRIFREVSMTRTKFISKNEVLYNGRDRNDFFDYNLLMSFPIIEQDGFYYCPYLPYIPYACSTSLIYRLTEGNDKLNGLIGKEVLEGYIMHLLLHSSVTNQYKIIGEFSYGKENKKSPDATVYSDEFILFLDSKSTSQSLEFRSNEKDSTIKLKSIVLKHYEQIIKNIASYEKDKFVSKIPKHENRRVFGMIITKDTIPIELEDELFTDLIENYKKHISYLNIDYIRKNIKLTSLVFFENLVINYNSDLKDFLFEVSVIDEKPLVKKFPDFHKFVSDLAKKTEEYYYKMK